MKMRMIKLTPEFFITILKGKEESFISNLPDDAELLDIRYDLFSHQILAIVRSNSFEDVPESYPIPEFNLTHTASSKIAHTITSSKLEFKPSAVSKPEVNSVKKMQIQPSRYNKVEEEFSPEQRELLTFKVDEDYVIVKPKQFLKAEWDDINNVVRSLGGKWVKGEIISYWQVPLQQS